MATAQDIARLRLLVNEPADVAPYTTNALSDRLDFADNDVRKVAGEIWEEKASGYAELTNVREGSSSRDLGDLHEQALTQARHFGATGAEGTTRRGARTRKIVRP